MLVSVVGARELPSWKSECYTSTVVPWLQVGQRAWTACPPKEPTRTLTTTPRDTPGGGAATVFLEALWRTARASGMQTQTAWCRTKVGAMPHAIVR
jgi:hypothetical protein